MKYFFDRHTDSLSLDLVESFECGDSEPLATGVMLHVDRERRPLMLEIQGASKIVDVAGLSSMHALPISLEEIARRMTWTPIGEAIWRKVVRLSAGEQDGGQTKRLAIPDLASPFSIR
ncbi:MAG TPA: hypothetical protein VN380_22590 [Thermoanaerobaculia bacterium]|jgi:hypothetical protein|nr:hypothetical protein [Thermoanaerobaculia bacterium]